MEVFPFLKFHCHVRSVLYGSTRLAAKVTDWFTQVVVYVPNTFSPNGDGMNDVFFPRGKGIAGIKILQVFNRWGVLVFQKINFAPNDQSAGWDGTFDGHTLDPDVYIYKMEVICSNNQVFPLNGNITLLK